MAGKIKNITIIGSGNIASLLVEKILECQDFSIVEIVARNPISGKILAQKANCNLCIDITNINIQSDVYIISVQDNALNSVVEQLQNRIPSNAHVVHTTGSASIQILENLTNHFGVIYPLQSIRKESNPKIQLPLFVDGNNPITKNVLFEFAEKISDKVDWADDAKRLKLHIAAVIVSNFTNYLFTLGEEYCHSQNIQFEYLQPLITETANRIAHQNPSSMQTGPAVRGDSNTIHLHENILEASNLNEIKEVYSFLTEKIKQHNFSK